MIGMVCRAGRNTTSGADGTTVEATGTSICVLKPDARALSRPKLACRDVDALFLAADGRVAQRESTALTWQGPQVQSLSRPPSLQSPGGELCAATPRRDFNPASSCVGLRLGSCSDVASGVAKLMRAMKMCLISW